MSTVHHTESQCTTSTPRLLSMKELMIQLNIGRTNVYELITNGKIKTVKIGRRRFITVEALEEFIAGLSAQSRPA